jgi:hypothetical protein
MLTACELLPVIMNAGRLRARLRLRSPGVGRFPAAAGHLYKPPLQSEPSPRGWPRVSVSPSIVAFSFPVHPFTMRASFVFASMTVLITGVLAAPIGMLVTRDHLDIGLRSIFQ